MVYSGDADMMSNFLGTLQFVSSLGYNSDHTKLKVKHSQPSHSRTCSNLYPLFDKLHIFSVVFETISKKSKFSQDVSIQILCE